MCFHPFWGVQMGCKWEEVQEWEAKKRGACYNCGTKGHFVKECHKKKQDWKNKFKGSIPNIITYVHA
jgi:hypothetical protein